MAQRTVFNREQYEAEAKRLGVYSEEYKKVLATVVDGEVVKTRQQNIQRVYDSLGWDLTAKCGAKKTTSSSTKTASTTSKKTKSSKKSTKVSAPKDGDRLSALESRMDSVESKLAAILAKLG